VPLKLAIEGGKPIREDFLSYGRQWIDRKDIQAVVEILSSDWLTQGPKVREFEEKFAKYCGAKFAVAVNNGTNALFAACFAAGIGKGDEVVTSPLTFVASANCILYCGGIPKFVDIDAKTYNLDTEKLEEYISSKIPNPNTTKSKTNPKQIQNPNTTKSQTNPKSQIQILPNPKQIQNPKSKYYQIQNKSK